MILLKINRLLAIHTSNVPLKFEYDIWTKLKLESGNRKKQYGHQAAILKVTSLKTNRFLPTNKMHMKFEIEILKQSQVTLQKSCHLPSDRPMDRRTDRQMDKVDQVYPLPPPTSLGGVWTWNDKQLYKGNNQSLSLVNLCIMMSKPSRFSTQKASCVERAPMGFHLHVGWKQTIPTTPVNRSSFFPDGDVMSCIQELAWYKGQGAARAPHCHQS